MLVKRAKDIGFDDWSNEAFPTIFWDLFGKQGHPVRTTVSEMGPLLLSRILDLNDAQEGVLNVAFKYADDNGLLLLDLKDLRALLVDGRPELGHGISTQLRQRRHRHHRRRAARAAGARAAGRRQFLRREGAGDHRPDAHRDRWPRHRLGPRRRPADAARRGSTRRSCSGCCRELFEELPEVGDPAKPKLVFFFDEAHLLFDDAPKALVDKVEQVVKLVRSKGVGVYFVHAEPDRYSRRRAGAARPTACSTRCAPIRRATRRR